MNMPQAQDFLNESEALYALLAPLSDADLAQATAFKGWTVNDVVRHLHFWNQAADLSLREPDAFGDWLKGVMGHVQGGSLREIEAEQLKGLSGRTLLETWHAFFGEMAEHFADADPSARLPWAGPSMSARSSITARLMETWAHGQEVYDQLGVVRQNTDGIRNIVVLGINTFGWTFKNRKLEVPETMPFVVLTAPSGEVWTYGEESGTDRIEGLAEAFCQVVTQTRNVADTGLVVTGPVATQWMGFAQCFAGRPETPPAPGIRKTREILPDAK